MHPGLFSDIEGWIHKIHIFLVQLFPQQLDSLAKTLEVDNLPFPKELDHVIYVRIIGQPQNIVIGDPCFLLWHAKSFATK